MEAEKLFFVKNDDAIYCGDNLEVIKYFPNECINLIYIDPPFFSGKNYDITFKDPVAVKEYGLEKKTKNGYKAIIFKDMFGGKLCNYLTFMTKRIKEIYRVLKSDGSFYLHCDWHAGHYLKMICDKIFGRKNFRNEIIWHYGQRLMHLKGWFNRKYDMILFYTKGKDYTFHMPTEPYTIEEIRGYKGTKFDKEGREYVLVGGGGKQYVDDMLERGKAIDDVWDIRMIGSNAKERLGYPTQKPEKLLERIIKASSNEEDIVADFFCGCGTTLAVAKNLGRYFIGVDKSPTACLVMAKRVEYENEIYGLKNTIIQMKDNLDWKTFQIWAVTQVGGNPFSRKQEMGIKKGEVKKETSAKGLDGILKAVKTNFNEDVPIEVKKHEKSIGVNSIRNFADKIRERGLQNGIFISASRLASGAKERIESLRDEGINILLITFDDLISPNLKLKLKNYGIFKRKGDRTADLLDIIK